MLDKLKQVIDDLHTDFEVIYENNSMTNIVADAHNRSAKIALIEEFTTGYYDLQAYQNREYTNVQVYFLEFCDFQNNAIDRQAIRDSMRDTVVLPFIDAIRSSNKDIFLSETTNIKFSYPPVKYDANEVGIMLELQVYKMIGC